MDDGIEGMKKKSIFKEICDWILALGVSAFLVNILIVPYYHFPAWIDIPANATSAIWKPGSLIVDGDEGYGIRMVDRNGYVNPPNRADYDSYILIMGASHSVGKEICYGYNYADLLESNYGFQVYNMAMDGHYYPQIINGFSAAVKEFPNAKAIVIEINNTTYTSDELADALQQREYDEKYLGVNIETTLSIKQKIKVFYQETMPLLRIINKNIKSGRVLEPAVNETAVQEWNEVDSFYYTKSIDNTLKLIRECYNGKVVIVYHPPISLQHDAEMEIDRSLTDELFAKECAKYGIEFVNMGEDFKKEYNENEEVPYGFMNTSLGSGHLNRTGHKLIAEKLAKILGDEQ